MNANEEFYIGWQNIAPLNIGMRSRRLVMLLLMLAVMLSVLLALAQRTIGVSVFEWGKIKSFSGILKSQPYPHLLVPRPGLNGASTAFSSYYLVRPFKFGFDPEIASRLDGQMVSLNGTLIYRGIQTMIEVADSSIKPLDTPEKHVWTVPATQSISFGRQTFIGEIVDSKCYLGVMNPGALTPHRACAIRCISGGIPPVLLVRQTSRPALYFLLVAGDGRPVNKEVLNLIAEPIEITGEVERQGELLILRADPATYRRVKG